MSSKTVALSLAAAAACPGLAFQTSGPARNGRTEVERTPTETQALPMVAPETAPDATNKSSAGVAAVGTLATAAVVVGRARRKNKTARKGLKSSPGFNTLPEFEKKKNGFEGVIGDQPPLGYWDPLGFSKDGDIEKFKRRREVEIKHGRVAMFATMGYITPEYFKLDGYLSPSENIKFSDVPNGLAAISKVPAAGWGQIFAFIGFIELVYNKASPEPGNYGKGVFGLGSLGLSASVLDQGVRSKKLKAELANGRLAMMAIIGMFFQDGLTGSAWGDWANYTDSPLRAFENELGAQPPFGFWDPLGLTQGGSTETFARRRQTEIKHGRISMLATMGYITPEITGKFPGMLSPSNGLAYNDIPNGLGAISKVPAAGWVQIFLYCAFVETAQDQSPGTTAATGDFGQFKFFLPDDEAGVEKKKASELANGRLAMMAITGMVTQDGLTGSAWGDWAYYTDSPLRAFESELGVQAPVGYFDPLGLSKDGDVATFKRRRATELKHGRISMLATMGYITPEITGKLPGYLSPSLGIKYADIPNGLGAISKVPGAGWGQIFTWCMFLEVSQDQQPGTPASEGDFGFLKALVAESEEVKKAKQTTELANGRLAMMAIIGMFYQDGLTGSAWGDWSLYTDSPLRAFDKELGVTAPLGYFDPLGMSSDGNLKTFRRRRASEIKNGRVAMYACMGWIVPEWYRFPGFVSPSKGLKFADIPNGMAALKALPTESWVQMGAFVACLELGPLWQDPNRAPGDFKTCAKYGFPMFFIGGREGSDSDPEKNERALNAEINNGRLAMMAITGMVFQNGITGTTGPEMWGAGAFESERGVQDPVGFFDPLGFTADGSVENFKRRRQTEIKHGRISMLATMGYITPEITGKLPGYLSPSAGLKFEDIPNGLGAISKVPSLGWAQMIAYAGFCELSQDQSAGTAAAEGDFGFKVLTSSDPAELEKKLSAEIANGRLAMMAIIGMFFQDGLTGSAWGDWASYTASPLR